MRILFILLFSAVSSFPKEVINKKNYSLEEAIDSAIKNSFEIFLTQEKKDLAKLKLKYKKIGLFLPEINLSAIYNFKNTITQKRYSSGFSEIQDPIKEDRSIHEKEAELSIGIPEINIFNSFEDKLELDSFANSTNSQLVDLNKDARDYFLDIVLSYFKIQAKQLELEGAKRRLRISKSLLDLAKTSKKVNAESDLDEDYLKSEYFETLSTISEIRNDIRSELKNLKDLTNSEIKEGYLFNLSSELNVRI